MRVNFECKNEWLTLERKKKTQLLIAFLISFHIIGLTKKNSLLFILANSEKGFVKKKDIKEKEEKETKKLQTEIKKRKKRN